MTASPAPHPFETLTPDTVLDALTAVGLWGDGRLTALNSFENRVYLAHLDEPVEGHSAVVLKFYRPQRWTEAQILEEHAFALELTADEVPVVPPLTLNGQTLHRHQGFLFSVSPRKGGRRPELDDLDVLEWVGRFVGRIHAVGQRQPFQHRPALTRQTLADDPSQWLARHEAVPLDIRSRWEDTLGQALAVLNRVAPELGDPAGGLSTLRLHGDCHPGNVLWTPTDLPGGGPHFVDLDDARTGPAVEDLWMLLPGGDRREQTQGLSALLDGYEQFHAFDRHELRLIEPLRTLRQIHYSAWLASRWQDPIFPVNFPWFGSSTYWAGQIHQLEEQMEAMQEPPLQV